MQAPQLAYPCSKLRKLEQYLQCGISRRLLAHTHLSSSPYSRLMSTSILPCNRCMLHAEQSSRSHVRPQHYQLYLHVQFFPSSTLFCKVKITKSHAKVTLFIHIIYKYKRKNTSTTKSFMIFIKNEIKNRNFAVSLRDNDSSTASRDGVINQLLTPTDRG